MSYSTVLHTPVNLFNSKSDVNTNALIARDGWQCAYCQRFISGDMMTVDHVIPTLRGGPDTLDNTVISCRECNARKGDMNLIEYRHWLAVRHYAFVIAPDEVITFEPVQVFVGDDYTTIALPALWAGNAMLCGDDFDVWNNTSGHVVLMTRNKQLMHVVILDGVLFDYYEWKKFE